MTTIYANVENERIVITGRPLVASGGVEQCRVVFTFSDYWDGLTKAAIFADRQKRSFYRVLLAEDGSAVVPWEVVAEKGAFWLGVEGVSGAARYTSELIRYSVVEGPGEGGNPQPPTPGIYSQILEKLDTLEAAASDGVPEYYREMLEEKEAAIREALNRAGRNRAAFIFLTDLHWDSNHRHSPALVRHLLAHTPINLVVCGGDILPETATDKADAVALCANWQDAFRFCGDKLFCVIGDSDRNAALPMDSPADGALTDKEMYSLLQSGMERRGVIYGDYFYYYMDSTLEKTRYVFLDSGRKELTQDCVRFFIDALASMAEGWHCIILSHLYMQCNVPSNPQFAVNVTEVTSSLETLINAYNARFGGVLNFGGTTINFNFMQAKGTVSACIGGHLHFDKDRTTSGGIPVLMFDCDGTDTVSGIPAKAGTVNEQAVTVVVADYDNKQMHCFRIGRGSDLTVTMPA